MKSLQTRLSAQELQNNLADWSRKTHALWWWVLFLVAAALSSVFFFGIWVLFSQGVGIWGLNQQVNWAFAITNFVWWIGIGHAGTFISAFLLITRQKWRSSINRSAEAMTLIAIACAGLFPIFHLGRPGLFYWLIPYPTNFSVWAQLKSSLVWDLLAITSYLVLSLVFWYIGLIPDFKLLYERARKQGSPLRARIYRILSWGWLGSDRQWKIHSESSRLLSGIAIALVISVHSIVSTDFAIGVEPGWHSTVFPPYFVAGAIYSGFAMVLTLLIPLRSYMGLKDVITLYHFDCIRKLMVVSGLIVGYGYLLEHFLIWYSNHPGEIQMQIQRSTGPQAWAYWGMMVLNLMIPVVLSLWKIKTSLKALFVLSLLVNLGMWLERYVIVVTSISFDFLPAAWETFSPTLYDWIFLFGSAGFFFFIFLLFLRFVPPVSIWEMKELRDEV